MNSIIITRTLNRICFLLKITYALLFIEVGADKFFNITTQWSIYVNPALMTLVPLSVTAFLHIFGALQIIIGILILSPLASIGMYCAFLMLIGIFINLVSMDGISLVLVHDLLMIILLMILMRLTTIQELLVAKKKKST